MGRQGIQVAVGQHQQILHQPRHTVRLLLGIPQKGGAFSHRSAARSVQACFTTASGLRSSCPAAAMNSFCRRMANAVGASALPVSRQLMIASSSVPVNQIAPYCTTVWTA